MRPATAPRPPTEQRILVVDAVTGAQRICAATSFADLLRSGDLVVVNDAATLPASLHGRTAEGAAIELRLASAPTEGEGTLCFTAALLGAGDYRTRTEDRPAPPSLAPGDILLFPYSLRARILSLSPSSSRLLLVSFSLSSASASASASALASLWRALYLTGRPVQYAHVPLPLALWDIQNVFAARPWAVEIPSAGRTLRAETLLALRARNIQLAAVTHAAGLSATGDPGIDARLPLPERFEVPEATARAIVSAKARGGRVLAIGTSVVRALESAPVAARAARPLDVVIAASGVTQLLLHPGAERAVVDGLLTGVHASDTTHFTLLGAFAARAVLDHALRSAEDAGLLGHELGDAWLVWGAPATPFVAQRERVRRAASATVAA